MLTYFSNSSMLASKSSCTLHIFISNAESLHKTKLNLSLILIDFKFRNLTNNSLTLQVPTPQNGQTH